MQVKFNPVVWRIFVIGWVIATLMATALFGGELPEMEVRYVADTPEEAAWKDEFPLAVVEVEPTYDLTQAGEPAIECTIRYEIVHQDHKAIEHFRDDDDRDVFFAGGWGRLEALETYLQENECPI